MCRKGNPFALWVGMQTGEATVENNMEIPQKIKNVSAFGSSNPTSGAISEETQNTNLKEYMPPLCSLQCFTIARIWKQPKCQSVD